MVFLSFIIACFNWTAWDLGAASSNHLPAVSNESRAVEPGYYFCLATTPLSENQYIFVATPLKKGNLMIDGRTINVSYTMTDKDRKGFTDYFSGENYNVRLIIRDEIKSEIGISDYRGILEVQHGAENRKYKVHGRRY
ncbi:hypothetical protein [Dyadobacter sp. CY351]|jgi:hypothetical protein|uniref:hypothetical protein n=1 Tax=Dyadobacter sp. CY351 TaxID=2909337 RepID=UPI001F469BF2|nr:hypothetical protein [Dyadobacter sp. CY351]MCF2517079.1 hypothetical protein [Dyadobacter sp. CY351]